MSETPGEWRGREAGGPRGDEEGYPETHERRPNKGRRLRGCVSPPGGVGLRSDPPRWCSYYCRSLHITSFRSQTPYSMAEWGASGYLTSPAGPFPVGAGEAEG